MDPAWTLALLGLAVLGLIVVGLLAWRRGRRR
jgi:LPXTG-motif cell wall-anchored protein